MPNWKSSSLVFAVMALVGATFINPVWASEETLSRSTGQEPSRVISVTPPASETIPFPQGRESLGLGEVPTLEKMDQALSVVEKEKGATSLLSAIAEFESKRTGASVKETDIFIYEKMTVCKEKNPGSTVPNCTQRMLYGSGSGINTRTYRIATNVYQASSGQWVVGDSVEAGAFNSFRARGYEIFSHVAPHLMREVTEEGLTDQVLDLGLDLGECTARMGGVELCDLKFNFPDARELRATGKHWKNERGEWHYDVSLDAIPDEALKSIQEAIASEEEVPVRMVKLYEESRDAVQTNRSYETHRIFYAVEDVREGQIVRHYSEWKAGKRSDETWFIGGEPGISFAKGVVRTHRAFQAELAEALSIPYERIENVKIALRENGSSANKQVYDVMYSLAGSNPISKTTGIRTLVGSGDWRYRVDVKTVQPTLRSILHQIEAVCIVGSKDHVCAPIASQIPADLQIRLDTPITEINSISETEKNVLSETTGIAANQILGIQKEGPYTLVYSSVIPPLPQPVSVCIRDSSAGKWSCGRYEQSLFKKIYEPVDLDPLAVLSPQHEHLANELGIPPIAILDSYTLPSQESVVFTVQPAPNLNDAD